MRRCLSATAFAAILGLVLGSPVGAGAQQPVSEGHAHKWQVIDKSLYDFVAGGYHLAAVVYDTAGTGVPTDTPDVHYFLQKNSNLVRCDFRKRGDTSYYWCYLLTKPNQP